MLWAGWSWLWGGDSFHGGEFFAAGEGPLMMGRIHPLTRGGSDCEDVGWAEHVGAEDDPFAVGGEGGVGFEGVVVFGEVDEALAF